MKRLTAWAAALLISILLCTQALAAGSAELVRVFAQEGTLYAYVAITGNDTPITKAEAKIGTQTFPASGRLETVQQAGFPISYLLLVDNSTSMPPFQEDVSAFAAGLAKASGENTSFTLATFGDDLAVVAEDIPTEDLAETISAIPYNENVTRLHTCIDKALDYFEAIPREGNELRCLVVLSDAVQYDPTGGTPYETLLARLSQSDVMLHSIGFGSAADLDSMGTLALASGGTHQVVGAVSAGDAAVQLSAVSGSLFVTGFDIHGYTTAGTETVSVTFASGGELICRADAEVDIPVSESIATFPAPAVLPPVTEAVSQQPEQAAEKPAEKDGNASILLLIVAVVILVIAAAAVMLFRRKKTPAPMQTAPAGIYVRLEVLQGELTSKKTEWNLTDELLIGRDGACDIVFDSQTLSAKNTRVFTTGGAVYIEDLGSRNGTLVNGDRIDMPSILHSGDKIAAGDVSLRLKF